MRQPINNPSRVPAYQNSRKAGGFCSFSVKPSNIGEGLVRVDVSLVRFSAPERSKLFACYQRDARNEKMNLDMSFDKTKP